jgi:hypothetical protein
MNSEGRPMTTSGDRNLTVSLGCGTLIIIALIVMFFTRGSTKDLERDVKELRTEVGALKKTIEMQTDEIKALREKVGK